MATTLPRLRPDRRVLTGLLFAAWSVIVLAAYFSYHPLPMRDGVPVWKGLLTVFGMLVVSWPLWRHADPRRGLQVEHLLLLPILLVATLVMLPLSSAWLTLGLWLLWVFAAYGLRQRFGMTGVLLALFIWFPGRFAITSATQMTVTAAVVLWLLATLRLPLRQPAGEPHRYMRRAIFVALGLGVLLSLADIQRRYAPIGYLTGVVDKATWLAQHTVLAKVPEENEQDNIP